MNIFEIVPEEVVEGVILPMLGWNDLLRLRRVSKATKAITDSYMKVHPERAPEIEISEEGGERSFRAFLQMNIPTTRVFLNNSSGDEIYGKDPEDVAAFLDKFGSVVKHFRVEQLSLHLHGKEWDFLDALVNLEGLEAGHFGYGKKVNSDKELVQALQKMLLRAKEDPRFVESEPPALPEILKTLKSLKIGQEDNVTIPLISNRIWYILSWAKELEYLRIPLMQDWGVPTIMDITPPEADNPPVLHAVSFVFMLNYITQQADANGGKPNLKEFDFAHYHDKAGVDAVVLDMAASIAFPPLAKACVEHGILLMNVSSSWFQKNDEENGFLIEHGLAVGSLVDYHANMFNPYMHNLQRIQLSTAKHGAGLFDMGSHHPTWFSCFESLDITVDSKLSQYYHWGHFSYSPGPNSVMRYDTRITFKFFFERDIPTNVTDLRLNFAKDAGLVAIPKTEHIVAACPKLTKLTLVNWPGTNKALITLFGGLPTLEELSLDRCKKLGNVAFVGVDTSDPVFLKLTNLKKLSLKGLDQMPKITDLLFSLVIRHMKLSHFIVTSEAPVTSVTSAGVLALLDGVFAQSIERFPFSGWALDNSSAEEFKELEMEFRSYYML